MAQSIADRLHALYAELDDIERQQEDKTLPHSDQHILDQAWDDIMGQIEELEELVDQANAGNLEQEDDDESEDERPQTVTIAPPPPSITLQTWVRRDGTMVAGLPPTIRVTTTSWRPELRIKTPPSEEEDDGSAANDMEDDREGCRSCSGCMYCETSRAYDEADEI
jgi:hypothetical protein